MLSVAVMAHPSRMEAATALAEQLDAQLVWDAGDNDEWHTGSRALAAFDPTATHHLVLQDDALPVPGFFKHAAAAIAQHPDSLISFYLGTARPPKWQPAVQLATETADQVGASWISCPKLLHGVALALPTVDIPRLLAWAERSRQPYDERIGTWYRYEARRPVMYTWPSLVDHADGATVARHPDGSPRVKPRVARRVGVPTSWDTDTISI